MNTDYNELLYEKMHSEYDEYCSSLLELTPQEIMDHSYETAIKSEVLSVVEGSPLTQKEAKALCKLKYPLGEIYHSWLKNDRSIEEPITDTISDRAKKEIGKNKERS